MNGKKLLSAGLAAAALLTSASAFAADKVRIGYWSSGVSLGYGSVLEATDFLKNQDLDVEFVRFPDVNAPLRALASNSIDFAFGAPAAGVFSSAAEGVPVKVVAATQPADVQFVVPEGSPITSLEQLRGKKVGMSPAGSSVAVIAGAVLDGNYGIKANDFSLVGGNEARLAQFLAQKQVDASALRSVTIAQLKDLKVTPLGSFADEWKKLTKTDSVPYIGIGTVRSEFLEKHPEVVARVLAGLRNTLAWGDKNRDEVATILQKSANLPEADARVYAGQWSQMNRVAFEPADIDTLKREHEVFKASGMIKGELPADLFVTGPYEKSKSIQ
ncbi:MULTISPECIES: ABC transporter substrate-binding protein [unclassified Bordetella]|uniref:ABC transporter substrate-binding protein n=1 Tax=unclassified Bordetella TaxID=2630031 RepID=UPI001324600F|nr:MULTISPECIES: ABC transporter substrate-binding protein [unclassified Bordetella]MVW70175.1 PhnD/SsuA/transferrin family substrate-binding protein [Bordetella sp. 15P40C-2]MVW77325.1 PhnD/SsuA/transferrin family substrate-binding protein [Bordetella sp. 02P26C-1]